MTTITRPSRGDVRRARWSELHTRLWCFSEQRFQPYTRAGDAICCASCGRVLIAERSD